MSTALRDQLRAIDLGIESGMNDSRLEEGPAGAVVAGSVVAFGPGVSPQHQQDVLQSLLFAQLAANVQAERHKQWADWYREYQTVLERIGWVVGNSSTASQWAAPGGFVFSTPVLETFDERAGDDAKLQVSNALTTFRNDVGGPAQFTFECPSHSGGLGNFQVALATEDDGNVRLRIGRFMFQAPTHVVRLAVEQLPANTKFYSGFVDMVLNEQVFSSGRSTIASRLGDRYQAQVSLFRNAAVPDPASVPMSDTEEDLGYDPGDPFGDLAGAYQGSDRSALRFPAPPPIIESVLVDEPGAFIRIIEERTVEPNYLYIVLETPSYITWWKSITLYTVRVPPGQDPAQFATNVQFLIQRVQPQGLVEGEGWSQGTALANPNAQQIGRIETKDYTHQATFRVEPWMLEGNEIHLEFHKAGFLGIAAHIPVEFYLRGGRGKRYTFRWERD
jgi:hypothetical protein